MSWSPPALYAILDVDLARARDWQALDLLDVWLDSGIRLIQIRAKSLTFGPMLDLVDAAVERARSSTASVIVNDRADVARLAGANGVHVGQSDLSPGEARGIVGSSALVGLSTHSLEQVDAAANEPVDYLAIGPVFPTTTKDRPDPVVGLEGVRAAADRARRRPVVAIGGITIANAAAVLASGASSVAVISDLLAGDPRQRARDWLRGL